MFFQNSYLFPESYRTFHFIQKNMQVLATSAWLVTAELWKNDWKAFDRLNLLCKLAPVKMYFLQIKKYCKLLRLEIMRYSVLSVDPTAHTYQVWIPQKKTSSKFL